MKKKVSIATMLMYLIMSAAGCSEFDSITSVIKQSENKQVSNLPDTWDITFEVEIDLSYNASKKITQEDLGLLVITGISLRESDKKYDTNIEQLCESLQVETDYPGDKVMTDCKLDGISALYVILTNTRKENVKLTALVTGKTKYRLIESN